MRQKTIFSLVLILILFFIFSSQALATPSESFEFKDDFESYEIGTNPTTTYDFIQESGWVPPPPPKPDLFKVGEINGNKVLQYYWTGSSSHFPYVSKLYKKEFTEVLEAEATFIRTQQAMGWSYILFAWQDTTNYYRIRANYDNKLYIESTKSPSGIIGDPLPLWGDKHILEMNHKINVKRQGNNLIATITRLDTGEQKSTTVSDNNFIHGKTGFGFLQDWGGPTYFNVDNFLAKGFLPTINANVDIQPETLNVSSKGNYVTAYIELPEGNKVEDINVGSVRLEETIPALNRPIDIGDYDSDGVADIMLKFDRAALIEKIPKDNKSVKLTVTGTLTDGTPFKGNDTINVKASSIMTYFKQIIAVVVTVSTVIIIIGLIIKYQNH